LTITPYYGATGQVGWIDDYRQDGEFVLLGEDGAPFLDSNKPKAYLVTGKCWVNNHAHVLRGKDGVCDNEFLVYALNSADYSDAVTGSTRLKLPQSTMNRVLIPNPPFATQKLIAAKLKSQLAEVETARQALNVQLADVFQLERLYFDEFERRLFSGAEISLFSNFVESYKNGYGARPKEGENGSIVLRIADVSQGIIDLSSTRQGSISAKDAETYKLEKGNLIFIRVNGAKHIVGKCILVDEIPDGTIFNDHLIRVRLSEEILPEYAQLCASLPNARQMIEEAASTSAGQLTVNQKILDQIAIPFVDKSCQVRMINEYRNLCSEISTLKKAINQQLDDLNKIPERLLAQAFNQ
jgi:type I restriction enzyme S subunit